MHQKWDHYYFHNAGIALGFKKISYLLLNFVLFVLFQSKSRRYSFQTKIRTIIIFVEYNMKFQEQKNPQIIRDSVIKTYDNL